MRPCLSMTTRSHRRSTSPMLCEASRIVAPRARRNASSRPRTQSAVSGSSEAVGSSSSRTSGSLISALASATRVFCPAERLPAGRSRKGSRARLRASSSMRRVQVLDAIETAEHPQVLAHGEAMRHVDVGALEIHAPENAVAVARHVDAEHADRARGRHDEPHDHADRRGLAGAVAAEQAGDRARRDGERDRVDGGRRAEAFGEPARFDGGGDRGQGSGLARGLAAGF